MDVRIDHHEHQIIYFIIPEHARQDLFYVLDNISLFAKSLRWQFRKLSFGAIRNQNQCTQCALFRAH